MRTHTQSQKHDVHAYAVCSYSLIFFPSFWLTLTHTQTCALFIFFLFLVHSYNLIPKKKETKSLLALYTCTNSLFFFRPLIDR